jgi:DNA-binding transcriptional LysR family regulator
VGKLVSTSIAVMRTAAAAGLELWLCPPYIVSDLLASGALVPLLPDDRTPELEIVALCPIGGIYAPSSGCSSTCWSTGSPKSSAGSMHARPVGPE